MVQRLLALGLLVGFTACATGDGPAGGGPPPPPPPPPPAPPGDVGFSIVDNAFVDDQGRRNAQASVTMTAGQMVGWIHNGVAPHSIVFDEDPSGGMAQGTTGSLGNGETHLLTLGTPGRYVFHCDIHPVTMVDAEIIVN